MQQERSAKQKKNDVIVYYTDRILCNNLNEHREMTSELAQRGIFVIDFSNHSTSHDVKVMINVFSSKNVTLLNTVVSKATGEGKLIVNRKKPRMLVDRAYQLVGKWRAKLKCSNLKRKYLQLKKHSSRLPSKRSSLRMTQRRKINNVFQDHSYASKMKSKRRLCNAKNRNCKNGVDSSDTKSCVISKDEVFSELFGNSLKSVPFAKPYSQNIISGVVNRDKITNIQKQCHNKPPNVGSDKVIVEQNKISSLNVSCNNDSKRIIKQNLYPRVVVERLDYSNNKPIDISSVCNKTNLKSNDNKIFDSVAVITKDDKSCCISNDQSSLNGLFSDSEIESNVAGDDASGFTTDTASEAPTVSDVVNESDYNIGVCNLMSVLNDHSYISTVTSGNTAKFNVDAASRSMNLNENTLKNGMQKKLTAGTYQTYRRMNRKRRRKAAHAGDVIDKELRAENVSCEKSIHLIDSQSEHLKSGICHITVNNTENSSESCDDDNVKSCDLPLMQSNCVYNKRVNNVESAFGKQSVEKWPNRLANTHLEDNSSANVYINGNKGNTSSDLLQSSLRCGVDNRILKEQSVRRISSDCGVKKFTVNNINHNKTFISDNNNKVTNSVCNISKCNGDFDQIPCKITDTFSLLNRRDHDLPAGLRNNLRKAGDFELDHYGENNLSNLVKSVCPIKCSVVLDRTAVEKWQRKNSCPITCKRPPDTDILTDYHRTKKLKIFENVRRGSDAEAEFRPLKNIQNLNKFQRVRKCNDNMSSNAAPEQNSGMKVTSVPNMAPKSYSIVKCDDKTAEDRFGTIRIRIQNATPKPVPAHIVTDKLQDYSKFESGNERSESVSVDKSNLPNANIDREENCERPVKSVKYKYRYCNCKSWNYSTTERNTNTLYPIVLLSDIKPQVMFLLHFDLQPVFISSRCHYIMSNRQKFRSCLFSKRYTE